MDRRRNAEAAAEQSSESGMNIVFIFIALLAILIGLVAWHYSQLTLQNAPPIGVCKTNKDCVAPEVCTSYAKNPKFRICEACQISADCAGPPAAAGGTVCGGTAYGCVMPCGASGASGASGATCATGFICGSLGSIMGCIPSS